MFCVFLFLFVFLLMGSNSKVLGWEHPSPPLSSFVLLVLISFEGEEVARINEL